MFWPIVNSLNNLPDTSIIIFDKKLTYRVIGGKSMIARGYFHMRGKTLYQLAPEGQPVNPAVIKQLYPLYKRALSGESFTIDVLKTPTNKDSFYTCHFFPIKNRRGKIDFAGIAIQDITSKVVRISGEQTELNNKENQTILHNISRRFIHLMGRVKQKVRTIQADGLDHELLPEISDLMQIGLSESQKILYYSGLWEIKAQEFSLKKLIHDACFQTDAVIEVMGDQTYLGDREKIFVALREIVLNAQETKAAFRVSLLPDLTIEVHDYGPGILSTEFALSPYSTTKLSAGLGLPLAKSIIERHGGAFSLETSDHGTRVTIHLKHILKDSIKKEGQ